MNRRRRAGQPWGAAVAVALLVGWAAGRATAPVAPAPRAPQPAGAATSLARLDEQFAAAVWPRLVAGLLEQRRVAVVEVSDAPAGSVRQTSPVAAGLAASLEQAGAVVASQTAVVGGGLSPADDQAVAAALGEALAGGGNAGDWLRWQATGVVIPSGDYSGQLSAVVLLVTTPSLAQSDRVQPLVTAIAKELGSDGLPVVAAEELAEPAVTLSLYTQLGTPSVDDADTPAGLAALVWLLAGHQGRFGVKGGTQGLIPDLGG